MKEYEFRNAGTARVQGKTVAVREYKLGNYFKVGGCRIPAKTKDEAVAKYAACVAKRTEAQN